MSPIVVIVFAPVVVIGLVFYAVLLGAAAAGVWEAAEARAGGRPSASRQAIPVRRDDTSKCEAAPAQPKSSRIGRPPSTIGTGRSSGSITRVSGSMPRAW